MASILNATTTSGLVTSADNSGSLQLQTNNGTTAVTIDTSQNVGIGTTTPATKLTVASGGKGRFYRADNTRYGDIYTDNDALKIESSTDPIVINAATGQGTRFQDAGTERMRITGDGNLIVGKTTTADTTVGATMQNSGRIAGTMAASTNATDTMTVYSTGAGLYRFYLGMGGTIYATSTTITGISDQRLKENIVDLPDGLDAVMALKPRKFDWKEGKGKNIKGDRGFIAQEFETVFPDMIETWKDPAPEGEEPYKGVNPNLIPTLVKAIQELKAELDATKAEVQALKGVA